MIFMVMLNNIVHKKIVFYVGHFSIQLNGGADTHDYKNVANILNADWYNFLLWIRKNYHEFSWFCGFYFVT